MRAVIRGPPISRLGIYGSFVSTVVRRDGEAGDPDARVSAVAYGGRVLVSGTREQLRQVAAHQIGAGVPERSLGTAAVDAHDEPEPAGSPRLHAGDRVLEDDGSRGWHTEQLGRLEEGVRRGLAGEPELRGLNAGDRDVEQLAQPGALQDRPAVLA